MIIVPKSPRARRQLQRRKNSAEESGREKVFAGESEWCDSHLV
jgi:hypothetical protein